MAKKITTNKNASAPAKKVAAKKTAKAAPVPNAENVTTAPSKKPAGMYLDTWMPVDAAKLKPNTVLYGDWIIPADKLVKKGKKPGLYADTWVPTDVKLKNRKG